MRHEDWIKLRRERLMLDQNHCQRCHAFHPYGTHLSPHHIVPRPLGQDAVENLISLCDDCHDVVEGLGLSRHDIEMGMPFPEDDDASPYEPQDWRGIDWRIRVYGGVKDAKKARVIMALNEAERNPQTRSLKARRQE